MPAAPPGAAPKASVDAPRAGGPKKPPRPARPATPEIRKVERNGDRRGESPQRKDETRAPEALPSPPVPVAEDAAPTPPTVATPGVASVSAAVPVSSSAAVPAGRRRIRRGRRVKRIVRRIDLWSVLKLALVVYSCLYLATLATLAALWSLAYSTGTVEKLQSFLEDVGLENFTFYGNEMFRACAAIGAVGVMAGTVVTVLATALVNVISEMTGGIRLVVIEEEPEG